MTDLLFIRNIDHATHPTGDPLHQEPGQPSATWSMSPPCQPQCHNARDAGHAPADQQIMKLTFHHIADSGLRSHPTAIMKVVEISTPQIESEPRAVPNWFDLLPALPHADVIALVDGGASASRAAFANERGHVLGYAEGGPTNARAIGNAQVVTNLVDILKRCADAADREPAQIQACLVATAGLSTVAHSQHLAVALASRLPPGIPIAVVPDAFGVWASVADLQPAIAVISGTGSVVFMAHVGLRVCRSFGGWDYILGDDGSGFAIGRAALRETLRFGEGRSSAASLARLCLEGLDLRDIDCIPDALQTFSAKAKVASLARLVLEAAQHGSEEAQALVFVQAGLLADLTSEAIAHSADGQINRIGCFGGVFRSALFRTRFESALKTRHPSLPPMVTLTGNALGGVFRLAISGAAGPLRRDFHAASARFDRELASAMRM
jgi:N-acetylglucosamine kinase-like BadF-type ATPase